MKNKELAKRIAVGILSGTMVVSAAPVSALAATQDVSIDMSEAVTSVNVDSSSSEARENAAIDLAGALVTAGVSTSKADGWIVIGKMYNYGVTSVSDVTFKMNDDGTDIGEANVTLTLSVMQRSTSIVQGTATIVVNLLGNTMNAFSFRYSAEQKINAVRTYAEAMGKAANEKKSFNTTDNVLTIENELKLDALPANLNKIDKDETTNEKAAGSTAVDVSIATGAVVAPTPSSDGSIAYTITYSAKDISVTNGVVEKEVKTATSSLSGAISSTKAQDDASHVTKIQNAIKAATWTGDDFQTDGNSL